MGEHIVMRQHFLILLIVFIILPAVVFGASPGDILKNQVFGLPDTPEWGYGLDTSADGNTTVCGVAYPDSSLNLGDLGNGDAWIIRFDKNGTILWEKLFGGNETEDHPWNRFRVNMIPYHFDAFYQAFPNINPGDELYLNETERARLW